MEQRLKKIKQLGVFTAAEVENLGIHSTTLGRWAKKGVIERVARGVYWHPDGDLKHEELDFAIACKLFVPEGFIGGLSALWYYQLVDFSPQSVWVVVPHHVKSKKKKFILLHSNRDANIEVIKKEYFRVASLERTVIEGLRYATKLGKDLSLTAAMNAVHRGDTTPEKLARKAKLLNLESYIEKHWDSLIAAREVTKIV